MVIQVSKAAVYQGAIDLSGDMTGVTMTIDQEAVDNTSLSTATTTRTFTPGLLSAGISAEGYLNTGDNEALLYGATGAGNIISVYPVSTAADQIGYGLRGARSQFVYRGQIGEMFRFTYDAFCTTAPLVRLNSMEGAVTKTETGNGTAYELGAVTAAQYVHCFLHVTVLSGTDTPTLTVKLQSSADGSTGWEDRISMTAKTAVGAEAKSLVGALTDAFWRITWTISGTTPSFTFIAGAGIV